jgi:hypothetical protein
MHRDIIIYQMFKPITILEHPNSFILEAVIGYDQDTYLDNTEIMIYIMDISRTKWLSW